MDEFFDREAVSSEGSEDDEVREDIRRHKKSKKQHKKNVDRDDDDSDEEEEDDDDEVIAHEMRDLINDDVEEEEEDSEDEIGRGHKRSHDDDLEEDLEDDDYDLIEENLGRKIERKKKFRRVRRLEDDDEDEDDEIHNTIIDREAIANELFDDDDDQPNRSVQKIREPIDANQFGDIDSEHSSEEEDNFIVDDNDQPIITKPRSKKSDRYTDQALQQAQDIFGVDFDYDMLDENEFLDEELEDEEYGDEALEERARESVKKKRQRRPKKSIFELYEPAELERSYLTDFDNEIRNTDLPERFQLRSTPVTSCEVNELREESEWIYQNVFEIPTITKQDKTSNIRQPLGGAKSQGVVVNIQQILHFIRNELYEVPFIFNYRKEYYTPDLSVKDLWLIYYWDEKWCHLQERKKNLIKLLENMKEYQLSIIMKSQDEPLPEDFRRITERDIKRAQSIQSVEEFNDCYFQFQLYYSQNIIEMRKYLDDQKREARELKKLKKQQEKEQKEGEENNLESGENDNQENENDEKEDDDLNEDEEDECQLSKRMNFLQLSKKRDTYTICKEFGIGKLACKYGLTPEQVGEHLSEAYHKHEIIQHPLDPLEAAQEHVSKRFDTPEKVLQAATFMVGKQLSCDPLFRKTVRQMFYERAIVNVKPTKKGRTEIDETHLYYSMKYLKNKPISSFSGEQFLQLNVAKNEGFLEVEILIDDATSNRQSNIVKKPAFVPYLEEIRHLYQRDEFSKNVQNWNEQRANALEIALNRFLYPHLLKELTAKLLTEAQFTVIQHCANKIASYISVAPYIYSINPKELQKYEDFNLRGGTRIMGFAIEPNNEEAGYCVMIDGDGEVTDYLKLEHFMLKRSGGNVLSAKEQSLRMEDHKKLKFFIEKKKPHVIALGADTIITKDVMQDLISLVRELHEVQDFPLIPIEYVDVGLATVYQNSSRANADFAIYPHKLRQAISLARRLHDPLNEFVQLCTPDEEILCLKLHPLQDQVPRDQLLNAIYDEFVNKVNEVGVDINKCLMHPYLTPLVQFIGGLGPRKGAFLLRTLKKQPTALLENRTQIVQGCAMGKVIFINCAGFLKIDTNSLADSGTDTYIEVLDSTRVHPEGYEWARKMAVDALDYEEDNDTNPAQALEEIIENPEKLRDLDLDEFAKELKRNGLGLKKLTLYDIRAELTNRFPEKRKPYRSPNDEEIFEMLTGENLQTFHVGKLVQVRITGILRRKPKADQVDHAPPTRTESGLWKCPFCPKDDFAELGEVWNHFDTNKCPGQAFAVKGRLDNGLNGMIPLKFLSDKNVVDPLTRVSVGMIINCRILRVMVERFSLELTCRTSDLLDVNNRYKPPKDKYYDHELEQKEEKEKEEAKKKKNRQHTYMKRIILHPSFHNIDFKKSEKLLSESPQGEAIIRPSSKGSSYLTLSWKVHDGIHQHVCIKEEDKSYAFSLGRQLFIGKESFEDLDEIIARYVQPMAGFARDMVNFKYFRDLNGDYVAAEKALAEEKQKTPSRIPYIISASKEFPGKFLLSYQPNQKAFHEYITVTPEGFKYRNTVFKSINALFRWFKEHFNDPSTFPRVTPGLQTPVNSSPFVSHQRTPIQNSPYVAGNMPQKQGFMPTPNINPQTLQQAAASMPNHLFNNLSQVVGQQASSFNNNNNNTFMGTPTATLHQLYAQSGGTNLYGQGSNSYVGQTIASGSDVMPPPPIPMAAGTSGGGGSRPGSRSGSQWGDMIMKHDWPYNNRRGHPSSMPMKPRTPIYNTPGSSSQMSISPMQEETPNINPKGDQTPLVDEWN